MKSFHKLVSSPLIAIITSSTNSLRGNHNQLADIKLCLHKAYVTFENIRKTSRKSSPLSSPCLDGTPAFPNSKSSTEHVMPRAARRGRGCWGCAYITSAHPAGTAPGWCCWVHFHILAGQPGLEATSQDCGWHAVTAGGTRGGRYCYRQRGSAASSSVCFYRHHEMKSCYLFFLQ